MCSKDEKKMCECEDKSHFQAEIDSHQHGYQEYPATGWRQTSYGKFNLCTECLNAGHMMEPLKK